MYKQIIVLIVAMLTGVAISNSQDFAVKNNILLDAALTPNIAFETSLSRKTSLDIMLAYSPFSYKGDKTYKHILVQPEFRYWLCEHYSGHFFGVHAHWGAFNEGGFSMPFGLFKELKDHRYEGQLAA